MILLEATFFFLTRQRVLQRKKYARLSIRLHLFKWQRLTCIRLIIISFNLSRTLSLLYGVCVCCMRYIRHWYSSNWVIDIWFALGDLGFAEICKISSLLWARTHRNLIEYVIYLVQNRRSLNFKSLHIKIYRHSPVNFRYGQQAIVTNVSKWNSISLQ